jgi:hypothetical protein
LKKVLMLVQIRWEFGRKSAVSVMMGRSTKKDDHEHVAIR